MREAVREAAGQEPLNAPTTRGSYYKAEVPDTLDLGERARLGLSYFSRIIEESLDREMYLSAATIRPDDFVSVHAAYDGGDLITRPLVFTGRRLSLNYSTSASGSVRVELLNSFGRPVAGFSAAESQEIFGDELERTATWSGRNDVGALAGQPVRLRFLLRDADVYSFRFTE